MLQRKCDATFRLLRRRRARDCASIRGLHEVEHLLRVDWDVVDTVAQLGKEIESLQITVHVTTAEERGTNRKPSQQRMVAYRADK